METPPLISILVIVILSAVGLLVFSMAALWLHRKIKIVFKNKAEKKRAPNILEQIDSVFQNITLTPNNDKQILAARLVSPGTTYDDMIWYENTINTFLKDLYLYFKDVTPDIATFVVYAAQPEPVFSVSIDVNQINAHDPKTRKAFDYAIEFVKLDVNASDRLLLPYCKEADRAFNFCQKYG